MPVGQHIPVIFISAVQGEKIETKIEAADAAGILQKPVTLISMIEQTLS